MREADGKKTREQLKVESKEAEARIAAQPGNAPKIVPKPVRHYRALVFQGYLVLAMVAFGALFFYARVIPYFAIDLRIELAIQSFHPIWFNALMEFVSALGFSPVVYVWSGAVVLILFLLGLRWEAVMLLCSGVGVSLLGELVKVVVQRARPTDALVNVFSPLNSYSFPSGHVLFYTAFIGFMFFLIYTLVTDSYLRTLGLVITGGLVALVGVSRIYLGQHWPSDVLGAYLLGSVWLALMVYLYRWGKPRFFVTQPKASEPASQSVTTGKI